MTKNLLPKKKTDESHKPETHPYLRQGFAGHFKNLKPLVAKGETNEEQNETPQTVVQEQVKEDPKTEIILNEIDQELQSILEEFPELKQEPLYIQNEEQSQSGVWSRTISISQEDYLNFSQDRLDKLINRYAGMLRNKQISPDQIPRQILSMVKSKV